MEAPGVRIPESSAAAKLRERTARNLRVARIRAGLTQRQVSVTSGIDIASLSRIERGIGNPTIGTIAKLAEAIGTDLADLFAARKPDSSLEKPTETSVRSVRPG